MGANTCERTLFLSRRIGGFILAMRSMPRPKVEQGKEIESPPRLGLKTINIVPFME